MWDSSGFFLAVQEQQRLLFTGNIPQGVRLLSGVNSN